MRGLTEETIQKMLSLRGQGMTLVDISRELGLAIGTVQRHCANPNNKITQDYSVTTLKDSLPKPDEKPSVIQGTIVGRQHSVGAGMVTKFVPDYNIEVMSTPLNAKYKFGPVEYTIDNEAGTIELNNPEIFMTTATSLKSIDDLCEYAKAVVGICETIKKNGKVKVWPERK